MRPERFTAKVARMTGNRPMLFLPDRAKVKSIPFGPTPIIVDGEAFEANFVKIALNVIRKPGEKENHLPAIVTRWFGPDAGKPGTRFKVAFEPTGAGLVMKPAEEE